MDLKQLTDTLTKVRNPLPLYLDWAGLLKSPYVVETRDGFICELRPGQGDRYGFYETLIRQDYLQLGQRIEPGSTVIDIGANVGCFAMLAARLIGDNGMVIAVEPESSTYKQLVINLARNKLNNVRVKNVAVSDKPGTAVLKMSGNSLFSSIYRQVDGRIVEGNVQTVTAVTLAQIMEEAEIKRCHYLKMDCEGSEYAIIDSLTMEIAERIDQMAIETHKVEGRDPSELHRRLQELGFSVREEKLLYAWR